MPGKGIFASSMVKECILASCHYASPFLSDFQISPDLHSHCSSDTKKGGQADEVSYIPFVLLRALQAVYFQAA